MLYTIEEVAKELKISEITVRRMIQYGVLKAVKIGVQWRIPQDEVDRVKREGTSTFDSKEAL